ncbi:transporter substrate-binding domain-containing protein [Zobellella sp. DQSA1]|uniref:transporter substrate-binding domain-containing protein n=1 Tax=Zobellella sp. DQSA1 TaxID=3342386 RepID=UPI0035C09B51
MFRALSFLFLLIPFTLGAKSDRPEPLDLLPHTRLPYREITLGEDDWRWLRQKKELTVGTSLPDQAPLDLSRGTGDYEGITADYLSSLADRLGMRVRVLRYASRGAALEALARGEVDLLGSATPQEVAQLSLILSDPYFTAPPVLVARIGETLELLPELNGVRLAVTHEYARKIDARSRYPQASFTVFKSTDSAMAAVAFGQAEVLLTDAASAYYLIAGTYSNYVRVAYTDEARATGFHFALGNNSHRLRDILNTALKTLPPPLHRAILEHWSGSLQAHLEKTVLTENERAWIERNPTVRVAVGRYLAPFSYFSTHGHYQGITADLLALIATKTGLRFDIVPQLNLEETYDAIRNHQLDIIADLPRTGERETFLRFTRPYQIAPYVLVTRNQAGSPETLEALAGKKLAIPTGHTLLPYLRARYPQIQLLETDNSLASMDLVKKGQADATAMSATIANYHIPRQSEGTLRIASTIESPASMVAFSVRRDQPELHAILEKTLRSIPLNVLDTLSNRWHTTTRIAPPSWRDYSQLIYRVVAISSALLLLALLWAYSLRREVEQRKMVERALGDQLQFMETLLDGIPHPLYVRDRQQRLLMCNHSYLQVLSDKRANLIGTSPLDLALREAPEYAADYRRVMASGEPLLKDREVHIRDRHCTIYSWILPYRNALGEIQGIIGGWLDVSDRRQLLEELRQARQEALDASQVKTTFLATMSHEIRTPLNAIIGMLELTLKRAEKGQLDHSAIKVAYGSAQGLIGLIGDILDISRIESGLLTLSPERTQLRQLVESVVRVFDGLARQKGLQLKLEMHGPLGQDILLDPLRFKQILSNLVSNAIKFTERGDVVISMDCRPLAQDRLGVTLTVRDTGIGISAEDQLKLFQPFSQVAGADARSGAGLGLAIARTLCEMMGGELRLSSNLGEGTCVSVALELEPLALREKAMTGSRSLTPKSGLRLLIVDDNLPNRLLLHEQASVLGHRVESAVNGEAGLLLWQNTSFDIVITDCNMPVMNGYQLARRIREEESRQQRPACRIYGYTANAQEEERKRCLAAGMDDCIFKPVGLDALARHLDEAPAGERIDAQAQRRGSNSHGGVGKPNGVPIHW